MKNRTGGQGQGQLGVETSPEKVRGLWYGACLDRRAPFYVRCLVGGRTSSQNMQASAPECREERSQRIIIRRAVPSVRPWCWNACRGALHRI